MSTLWAKYQSSGRVVDGSYIETAQLCPLMVLRHKVARAGSHFILIYQSFVYPRPGFSICQHGGFPGKRCEGFDSP